MFSNDWNLNKSVVIYYSFEMHILISVLVKKKIYNSLHTSDNNTITESCKLCKLLCFFERSLMLL